MDDANADDTQGPHPVMLRKVAKAEEDARVARRMLAIANALESMSREAPAEAVRMEYIKERFLSLRLHNDYDSIADAACKAWTDSAPRPAASSPCAHTP